MKNSSLDRYDRAILAALQRDASVSIAELAEKTHLSATPCWRRVQRLEERGIIRRRVALLDAAQLNVGATVFVSLKTNQHNLAWLNRFAAAVTAIPEITETYRMTGEVDYLLKVSVPDIAGYDAVYKKLIKLVDLHDVSSGFAMEQLKFTTELPLDYA